MTDEAQVLDLENSWSSAPHKGDLETVAAFVADDWLGVGPQGETMTKTDLLSMLAANPNAFDSVQYDDVKLNLFGETAIVTSSFHGVGKELSLKQRFMRVYAKRNAKWQCVATQIVPTL